WVQDAIFYQIFPDRFSNGDLSLDPPNLQPWGSAPTLHGFQGGDLRGVMQRFDYLLDLGINAIYFNPIFLSPSTHRYNTTDYYQIDPKLGDQSAFKALLDLAHRHNVHVLLDGVFNHCGRGFFAFNDILENQEYSPYRDWFHVSHFPVDAYSHGDAKDFLGWWKFKSLPKFNTASPAVRSYLLGVGKYWIEQGIDGWRLDVPNEIDDDPFWAEFRETIKAVNPEAYILGEIWDVQPRWVSEGHCDGLMNYPLRTAIVDWLGGRLAVGHFAERAEQLLTVYHRESIYAQYNLLGSHDTPRLITLLNGDWEKVKLANAFLFAYPGAPSIYYGDEVGLEGDKDPDCRRAFPWDSVLWKDDLRTYIRKLVGLRREKAVLRRGEYQTLLVDIRRGCMAFARALGDHKLVVALNNSANHRQLQIPVSSLGWTEGKVVHHLLQPGDEVVEVGLLELDLPPFSAAWLE
ncbi:MAG TPA: glycoside hydrolase family 13 protein, partial [Anaerolineaceae bacterium]|nr:glycoside hydrolase family 13 protein [Anaerolineaceae bacterium]